MIAGSLRFQPLRRLGAIQNLTRLHHRMVRARDDLRLRVKWICSPAIVGEDTAGALPLTSILVAVDCRSLVPVSCCGAQHSSLYDCATDVALDLVGARAAESLLL